MKPKIKCKKVKITAEQMERIRAQEQERESNIQNTSKVTVKQFEDLSSFKAIILCLHCCNSIILNGQKLKG